MVNYAGGICFIECWDYNINHNDTQNGVKKGRFHHGYQLGYGYRGKKSLSYKVNNNHNRWHRYGSKIPIIVYVRNIALQGIVGKNVWESRVERNDLFDIEPKDIRPGTLM